MTLYPRSRFLRNAIFLVCFALVLVALDLIWVQLRRTIHPRYDTTRIVEPTMKDGTIDYLTAMENYFSRGITRQNNAAPLLLEALGRNALPKTQPPDGITSRLGMPHLPEKGDYFVTYSDFTKAREGKAQDIESDPADTEILDAAVPATSPMVSEWLAANEKPLAKIREATTRSKYFLPFDGGNRPELLISILLPHVSPLRDASRALSMRALARINAGDIAGATEDGLTLHRLARLFGHCPTLVERLLAVAIEYRGCYVDRAIGVAGKATASQLRTYAGELAELADLEPPGDAIDMAERYLVLDATQHLAHLSPVQAGRLYHAVSSNGDLPAAGFFPFLPIPYEQSMIEANAWYDGLLAAFRQPTYALRRDALAHWEQGVNSISASSHFGLLSPDWALSMFLPSLNRFQTRWETARAQLRLVRVSLLLAIYKQEHNSYPESLADLSQGDLKQIPGDNFTNQSFIYARNTTGYSLRSVGPNLNDDDGGSDDITANVK